MSDYALTVAAPDAPANSHEVLLASAARTATTASSEQTNTNGRGVQVVFDITSAPAVATGTVTAKLQSKDPASGTWSDLLEGAAVSTTGTRLLTLCPGITETSNESASAALPKIWRAEVTHTNSESYTYSLGANVVV